MTSATTPADTLPLRREIPVEMTWDLRSIYATDAAWEAEFARIKAQLPEVRKFQGRLTESAVTLLQALTLRDRLGETTEKLYVYAHMRMHEDTADSTYQALSSRVATLSHELQAHCSFYTPEILAAPPAQLTKFLQEVPALQLYKFQLEELNRTRPRIRTAEVEELIAKANDVFDTPSNVYEQFSNADLELPKIEDIGGKQIQLTQGNYVARFLQSRDRGERKRGFDTMLGTYKKYRNTFASMYQAQVKKDIFMAQARHYDSSLECALDAINVPVPVYDTLIETVHENLPKLHRYLALRKEILWIDELHMYDLYVPIVEKVEDSVEWRKAKETVLKSLAPLGEEYVAQLEEGFDSRWIDVLENKGKRSGAYSWGAYGTNPYMLLNWQGNMDSMFTLAHEAGHSMHSYFSRKSQPYPYANYTLFVAEVASTCNEALLTRHLLQTIEDKPLRAMVINDALEGFRTTLYRQTLFAEFEKKAHEQAEAGEALTPDLLCSIFKTINETYYGGACVVDEIIENEWMRIPHFFSSFYVYQYATGISAATALASQILTEGEPAVKRYLKFLNSGSSDYSINILRDAGVDLSTPTPIQQALDTFAEYLVEFEKCIS